MFKHTFTADGASEDFIARGPLTVVQSGTYGGGTVKINIKDDEAKTYTSIVDAEKTADDQQEILTNGFNRYQLEMTGSTSPNVTVIVYAEDADEVR